MTLDEIRDGLANRAETVAMQLFPEGRRQGNEWRIGDVTGRPGKSLGIVIDGDKAGTWQDFAESDKSGSLLDLWAHRYGYHGAEGWVVRAAEEAAQFLGGTFERRGQEQPRQQKKPSPNGAHAKPVEALPSFENDWKAANARVGNECFAWLEAQRGYSRELCEWLKDAGLIGVSTDRKRIAFPVHDENGNVIAAHGRHFDRPQWGYIYKGDKSPGSRPLWIGERTAKNVWVFESQWDALAVIDCLELWRDASAWPEIGFFITRGASNGRMTESLAKRERKVWLWAQRDEVKGGKIASEEWIKDALEPLKAAEATVRRIDPADGFKDYNDWLRERPVSPQDLLSLVSLAKPLTEPPLRELLSVRRFDPERPPKKPEMLFSVADQSVATAGNLVAIQAQAKAGKTAMVSAILSSTIEIEEQHLGVRCHVGGTHAVIHFDTEQSPYDHWQVVDRALRRANCKDAPGWLLSYYMTDLSLAKRRQAVREEMAHAAKEWGGIRAVVLDGLGDLCVDPNDPAEAFGLVDELHQLAILFSTVIVCVLHENPGSESGKTRGHLGSQLERKAESNLRLVKENDATVLFCERGRHCCIPKDKGPRFAWSDEAGMHVMTEAGDDRKAAKKFEDMTDLAVAVFREAENGILNWEEAHERIQKLDKKSPGGSRHVFRYMVKNGIIVKTHSGNYALKK